jgi:hypothetical protein
MKFVANQKKLNTPQKTASGKTRVNIAGEPIYTTYLGMVPSEELKLRMKMRKEVDIVFAAQKQMNKMDFCMALGFNTLSKKQIDNEPKAYNWEQRLAIVDERLKDNGKQLTMGIIDMYNNVVGSMYRGLGYDNDTLNKKRIDIAESGRTSHRPSVTSFNTLFDREGK